MTTITKEIYEAAKLLADFAIANGLHGLLDETAVLCDTYETEHPHETLGYVPSPELAHKLRMEAA